MYHKTHPDLLAQNGKGQPHIRGNITGPGIFLVHFIDIQFSTQHLPAA